MIAQLTTGNFVVHLSIHLGRNQKFDYLEPGENGCESLTEQ